MRALTKSTDNLASFSCDTLIIAVYNNKTLSQSAKALDKSTNKVISRVLNDGDFNGERGETLVVPGVGDKTRFKRILLWGLGDKDKLSRQLWVDAANSLGGSIAKLKGSHAAISTDFSLPKTVPIEWAIAQLCAQLTQASYRYTATKSPSKTDKENATLNKITVLDTATANAKANSSGKRALSSSTKRGLAIGQGINLARELGNLPGNICTPKYLSSQARKLSRASEKLTTKILGERQMQELGMGSLLSVGHGSIEESQLIIMDYRGGKKGAQPIVLVGKGITFDSGGISLKPGAKMDEMKFDMCGAASVFGTLSAIVEMKLPINVIGVVPAAENMPSDRATKPGDVVTSMAGKTIEILNTDAEGRLVLCDALEYVKRFKPSSVIDMATLTGACIVALGHHASGLMSNNDELADALLEAGVRSGDRAWRLPLWDEYQKQLSSPFADIANIGGPSAGTITAGCFLSRFTEDYPWAHLDIAGTAWNQGGGKGASGRPVSLLCEYLIAQATK